MTLRQFYEVNEKKAVSQKEYNRIQVKSYIYHQLLNWILGLSVKIAEKALNNKKT